MNLSKIAKLPTRFGEFHIQAINDGEHDHILIFLGELQGRENVPFRVHSECLTSEVLGSLKCDCREQLETSLEYIQTQGFGAVLYLRQEGRGIGLFNKVDAYALQDAGLDTIEANEALNLPVDLREYSVAVAVLKHIKVASIDLLTNNPLKIEALQKGGIDIAKTVRLRPEPNEHNFGYIETKRLKMNHI
jgi:GTP cyclohydrolase II